MYQGVFLNLPRSEKRRTALLAHLAEVGAADRYRHFPAVDGRAVAAQHPTSLAPGNLGLWLSHEQVLQMLGPTPTAHLHLIEDDAVLPRNAVPQFEGMLQRLDQEAPDWDLLFTDVFLAPHPGWFRQFANFRQRHAETGKHTLVDLANAFFAGTSSLFINKASVGKYAALLAGNWQRGLPIDIFLRSLVNEGKLKAYLTVPHLTSISPEANASEISGRFHRSRQVCELYRRAFFQEANLVALLEEMQSLTATAKVPPLAGLYLHTESFMLSDQWQHF